jgi:hypothetical protein
MMGAVYDLDLPHHKQSILLAMADHADHNGEHIYPSYGLIAWKTGYSVRQVQRIVGTLVADGLLVKVGISPYDTVNFKLELSAGRIKKPYTGRSSLRKAPRVKMSQGDKMTPVTSRCPAPRDIAVSPKPSDKPSTLTPIAYPALSLYMEAFTIVPTEEQQEALQAIKDLERWKAILDEWKLNGWGPNVGSMLDRYKNGPKGKKPATEKRHPATQKRKSGVTLRPQVPVYTDEQREAGREAARKRIEARRAKGFVPFEQR